MKKVFIITFAVLISIFLTTCKKVEVPTQPTDVKAWQEGTSVIVSWKSVKNATTYRIYRSASENYVPIGTVSKSGKAEESFIDKSPLIGMNYYKATAFNEDVESLEGGYATCNFTFFLPILTTLQPKDLTITSATLGGNISDTGNPPYTERGVCWSTSINPTTTNNKQQIHGSGTGEFKTNVTNLVENTVYYVRAYATNSQGTAYGEQLSFKTENYTITISDAYNISFNGAQFDCSVTSNTNVTDKGICYSSQHSNPTTEDLKISKGSGTGNYNVTLTDLTDNTTYYVRPYTVANGETFYGNVKKFTTKKVKGVVINGVDWATHNVDRPGTFTTNPEDAGMFYQWNRKMGWSSTNPLINSNGGTIWDTTISTGDSWNKVNDPCPFGWRVPTREEIKSLVADGSEWTNLNDINGRIFGRDNNTIFFPATGNRYSSGVLVNDGISGSYWSSIQLDSEAAMRLSFNSWDTYLGSTNKGYGMSVRCVAE